MATGRIYSIGYEGFTLAALIEALSQNRVAVVFDVRLNAVSRRPGFSKRKLAAALDAAGIEYVHEPTLGNPTENRAAFAADDPERARQVVSKIAGTTGAEAVERLATRARSARVAVMCVERAHRHCHRSVVIDHVQGLAPDIEVISIH